MIARIRPEANNIDILRSLFKNKGYKKKLVDELCDFYKVEHALLTSSARAGLYVLLKALPQSRIYLPAYTCWVVAEAAMLAGKEVVYVDIKLDDYNIDVDLLQKVIVPDSIILATHQYGIPCDLDQIIEIAQANNCFIIEDNAAGCGSELGGRRTGQICDVGIISFEGSKTLTSSKGGAVLFKDRQLFERVKKIQESEMVTASSYKPLIALFIRNVITQRWLYRGVNWIFLKTKGLTSGYPQFDATSKNTLYSIDYSDGMAKLAYLNLKKIQATIQRNKEISAFYLKELQGVDRIELPIIQADKSPVFMRFPIRIKNFSKEEFFRQCVREGMDLAFTFSYSCPENSEDYPNANQSAQSVLNLPIYSKLNANDLMKIKTIVEKVSKMGV